VDNAIGRYVYDLLVPVGKEDSPEFTPKPFDGEVDSFEVRYPILKTFYFLTVVTALANRCSPRENAGRGVQAQLRTPYV
jgi:hypothetical protein